MKKLLKYIFPVRYRKFAGEIENNYLDGFSQKSYSQEGEDMILRRIFEKQSKGFYIDIGAHHPKRFSNTFIFYRRGWHGINIDATPGSMKLFNIFRKRDINLELPVSDKKEILKYYIFNEPALNGFSKIFREQRDNKNGYKVVSEIELKAFTLEEILDRYLPNAQIIDFMSVDVEGFDFQVLKSNNWEKYKPKYILIEILDRSLNTLNFSDEYIYLSEIGYEAFSKTVNTVFFKRSDL